MAFPFSKILEIEDYFQDDNFIGFFDKYNIDKLKEDINHFSKYTKDLRKSNFNTFNWITKVLGIMIDNNLKDDIKDYIKKYDNEDEE